jgi:RimJ/RimL family protein N-acetyltransferase
MTGGVRPELRGSLVLLRAPGASDPDDRLAAGRDPEFRRMVGGTGPEPGPLSASEVERWYAGLVAEPCAWIIESADRCVGVARLHHIDLDALTGRYAIGIFRPEDRGRGIGQEVTRLVLEYAFGTLGLRQVDLRVLDFNRAAIECYRRCGFEEIEREPVKLGDVLAMDVIMVATPGSHAGPVETHGFDR